ncbi:MAG: 50S ribosomal protein P1 [Nitrososphaerota archaeon]|jgi:large subunit ribosomal protein L12|nr:50S ribosomal protein P1 [Nitrososphaerota archaeon]MDG6928110.1 50S ribosomal protein P1 [Nitrososphaerota archaeon]MDG6929797.1 50S ribosomal protein P1 [Nitrososphaerota archaeon]MDG6932088.1 50S ribosomal protein P1 [Nitrososphaerota archaeon]MDG6935381.1 50S ribosomal protein P1 [Nitrososphaerota archaeon]
MDYVYAALFLHSAGKEISEENLKKVAQAAGVEEDDVKVKALVAALKQVNIDDVLKSATAAPAAPAQQQAPQPAQQQAPAETKEEEKKGGEAIEGLSALFG